MEEKKRSLRKERTGMVVSNGMQKSVVVKIRRTEKHPIYKKYVNKSKNFIVHDEKDECAVGDVVRIMETRPLSKNKKWRVVEIIERAK